MFRWFQVDVRPGESVGAVDNGRCKFLEDWDAAGLLGFLRRVCCFGFSFLATL